MPAKHIQLNRFSPSTMGIFYRLALILTVVTVLVTAQGSRGGGSSGGGSSGSGSSGSRSGSGGGSSCTGDSCATAGIIAGSVIGSIFALFAIVFSSICVYRRCKGKPWRSNSSFVNQSASTNQFSQSLNLVNGTWSSQYHQYGRWHGPHQWQLQFDQATNTVTGGGNDDVGRFSIDGTFSAETQRIGLTKTYQLGTGNPMENSGHQVTIQLKWNPSTNRFEGKWYVQTKKYRGEGNFYLTSNDHQTIDFEKKNFDQ